MMTSKAFIFSVHVVFLSVLLQSDYLMTFSLMLPVFGRTKRRKLELQQHHDVSRRRPRFALSLSSSSMLASESTTTSSAIKELYETVVRPIGTAIVDYSMAEEYVLEHYRIPRYFGGGTTCELSTKRREKVFNAREGVFRDIGNTDEHGQQDRRQLPTRTTGRLNECGFELFCSPTKVSNFRNLTELKEIYEPELSELIPKALGLIGGSDQVLGLYFWHPVMRGEEVSLGARTNEESATGPIASRAHIDTDVGAYGVNGLCNLVDKNRLLNTPFIPGQDTEESRTSIYEEVLDMCQDENRYRVLLLNIWRPLVPVSSAPLGILATKYKNSMITKKPVSLNGSSDVEDDSNGHVSHLEPSTRTSIFPTAVPDFTNNASRWYIFSDMQPDECLIFKQYDRRADKMSDLWHCALSIDRDDDGHDNDIDLNRHDRLPRKSFDIKAMVILKENVPVHLDRFELSIRPQLSLEESGDFCNYQASRLGIRHS